ncbi:MULTISPECIES: universal stress protein [Kocuria]|uniref:universal stress protein n=1 Tax=Kocuria TaxID=57493 RepID=UPI00103E3E58|nr:MULTISPECIES: universal stress protein [Kocuria]MCT2360916.1 universal stress protein [Kocuria marina]MDT0118867.1 universal stress protein [Kocuria sp. PD6]QBJ20501.1 universal stress protein [Kocuria indica]
MNNDVLNTSSNAPVLVGIDGSEIALRALDRALTEAAARKVPVRLLCAFPVAVVGDPGLEQRFHDAVKAESESHLEAAGEYARSHAPDVEIRKVLGEGDAARAVLHAAKDACLVVMGKRGKGDALRGRLGSVSAAVAAHSPVPVIVVPPGTHEDDSDAEIAREEGRDGKDVRVSDDEAQGGTRTPASEMDFSGSVVVGVDGAGEKNPAVAHAIQYALSHDATLSLVSVNGALSGTPEWFQDQYNQTYYFQESLERLSELARTIAEREPRLRVTQHAFLGRPGRVLVQATRTADLVVVGSRGIGGFTGLLLGSVSQAVLSSAAGPVMVVPSGR